MNRIFIAASLTLIPCSIALSELAIGQDRPEQVESSRFETTCPPASTEDQARFESQLSNFLGEELREFFGEDALPLDAGVEPLTESEHRDVCEHLTRVHKFLINSTTRRSQKADEQIYRFSVAYFEAGSFYFVLIGINPERMVSLDPGMDRVVIDEVAGPRVHLKDNMDLVGKGRFVYGPEHRKLVNKRIRERLEEK